MPSTVAHVSLALAITAYEQWLATPGRDLALLLDEASTELRAYLSD